MRVLVTGGAGFIGSNFIRMLLDHEPGVEVTNLDKLTYAGWEHTIEDLAARPGYRFVRGDVTDRRAVERVLARGVDAVVHFAAESHVDRSIHGPDPFVTTNVGGTHCVIESARHAGVARFIQISSDEVYGSIPAGAKAGPLSALRPGNPYAASKAGADLLALAAFQTHGFPVIITRCSNNYGPWQHPEKFIPRMTLSAMAGDELPVYGDGAQERNWIHVEDHCRALLAVLARGIPGRVYTIAGDDSRPNLEMARFIIDIAGNGAARIRHVADRPGHDRRYALDDAATRRELAWRPQVALDTGLQATVEWYRARPAWWRPIAGSSPKVGQAG
ncbi:MAG: dTDP-glucose 4,6-dehydratase [Acidobacteriota bacterium]